jgi:uncharacterized protein YrrD
MTTLPDAVRQSELLNQLVLNRSTMEEWGRIDVLWMYPPSHRVLGFVCKTGFLGRKKLAFKLSQVESLGGNGVLTHSQPDETDADRVSQLESLVQCEVWSQAGHKLGKIIDCVFNLRTGAITDYLMVGDRLSSLTGSIYRLPPHKVLSLGRERVLVAETALTEFVAYREGLQHKIAKVTTTLKDEYEDATEELRSLAKRAQETTQQTTGQIKTLAEQARERAQLLAEQARERAQELNEQWLESAQYLAEQARETTESLVERVQETAPEWPEASRDRPTVTVPAEAMAEWDEDLDDWDETFDFGDDEPVPTSSPAVPTPLQRVTPPPAASPLASEPTEDDFWVIGDDLTLQRRPSIAQDQEPFTIDDSWNLEDDPWDITAPPTEETPILTELPQEAIADEPPDLDQDVDLHEAIEVVPSDLSPDELATPATSSATPTTSEVPLKPLNLPPPSTIDSNNGDDEPWI